MMILNVKESKLFVYVVVAVETGADLPTVWHVYSLAGNWAPQAAPVCRGLHILCRAGVGHLQDLCCGSSGWVIVKF